MEVSEDVIKAGGDTSGYTCTAARETDGSVCFIESDSDEQEALRISAMVKELVEAGFVAYSDIAVLTRIRAVTNRLEEVFQDQGIPYAGIGAPDWLESPAVRAALAYLRLVLNPDDEAAMRLLERSTEPCENQPGVDFKQTVAALSGMNACGLTLWSLVERVTEQVERDMEIYSPEEQKGLYELRSLADEFAGDSRLPTFLDHIGQMESSECHVDAVNVLTIHQAKGLQFRAVFVVGMDEGILPCHQSMGETEALEEERRLCYVAMTRAIDCLCLCSSKVRKLRSRRRAFEKSRFVSEIGSESKSGVGFGHIEQYL